MDRNRLVAFLRDMLAEDLEVAAYRADPKGYLERHGFGEVARDALDEALPEAVAGLDADRVRLVRQYFDEAGPAATLGEAVAGMVPRDDEQLSVQIIIEPSAG